MTKHILPVLLLAPAIAWGQDTVLDGEWAWFRAVSTGTSWFRTGGKGTIAGSNSTFHGRLFDAEEPDFVRHDLTGSVSGPSIKVRLVIKNSDSGDERLAGHLKRLCYRKGGGREIIYLSDGVNILGLSRELANVASCKPTP